MIRGENVMVATDKLFAGSVPEIYDRYMVPLIFESYARDLAERLATLEPRNILETAAGTGVLTQAIASQLPQARLVATDLNQPMLDRAAAKLSREKRIVYRQADALALPFEDASFDAVACQFGAMFFPDKVQGYKEARRVLKPGGRFFFSVWGKISENEFVVVVTQALAEVFPDDPPRFLARTPHGYHDAVVIKRELSEAGFSGVVIETRAEQSRASSPRHAAVAYCQGPPLRNEIEARDSQKLESATDYASARIAERHGSGEIAAKIQAHVVVATN